MARFSKALAATGAAVLLSGLSVAAIAQVTDDGSAPPGSSAPAAAPPGSERAVQAVPPAVATAVGALRTARGADDVLPADVAEYVRWAPIEGANGDLARKAFTRTGTTVYVLPGQEVACILLTGSSGGATGPACDSPAELQSAAGGPGVLHNDCTARSETDVPDCRAATVFGLAPDGVDEVTIVLDAGNSVSAPVVNNAYLADVPGDPQAVRFDTKAGAVKQLAP